MTAPRLLLIDQDPADRSRAAAALMALFPLAQLREVDLGADFFDALKSSAFDIVITELATRWASWPFLLGAIRALQPGATILVYTREDDASSRRATLAAGASAYVVKSDRGLLDLSQAVDRVLGGGDAPETATPPPQAAVVPSGVRDRDPEPSARAPDRAPRQTRDQQPPPRSGMAVDAPSGTRGASPDARERSGLASATSRAREILGDREVGGPLAILAAVVAVTAILTALLLFPDRNGRDEGDSEGGPRGTVAAALLGEPPDEPVLEPQAAPDRERSAARSAPAASPSVERPLASDAPVAIELRPRAEVWVRLIVDGEKVLEKTLRPDEDRFFEGRRFADLTIGDAAAVTVFWNGTDLGNLGAEGQVRRLNLWPTRVGTGPAKPRD